MLIPVNKTDLIMYAFGTQSRLTAGIYTTFDFSKIFFSFSNHFQRLKAIEIAKEPVSGFQVHLYILFRNDQPSTSYWCCTGKSCDCQVYIAFGKCFEHPSYVNNEN